MTGGPVTRRPRLVNIYGGPLSRHLRYAVTRGLVCATKPSSPPRVTLTLYRPFRTILQKRDCLLHVRYRGGARVTDILAYLCSMLPEPSGNKNRPFALASRPNYYLSRPPPYPRLRFGLRAYDTYQKCNAHPLQFPRPPPELQQKPQ